MMPAGVAGELVSSADLAEWGNDPPLDSSITDAHRSFRLWRRQAAELGPASSLRSMTDVGITPLAHILGYAPATAISASDAMTLDLFAASSICVPCLVRPWGEPLQGRWREASLLARRRQSRWAFLFNGTHMRLLDALRAPARRWLEFDLDLAADSVSCFGALWKLVRASMLGPHGTSPSLDQLIDEADLRATAVSRSLKDGVLSASGDILSAIITERDARDLSPAYEQALTVVYRMLFLLFAESRAVVPVWHPVYKASYSFGALRDAAERGRTAGLWDAVRAISRLAHAGCRAGDLKVTPFNGRLFDATRAPLVERRRLDDGAASRAILALTMHVSRSRGRQRIAYQDLGVEQLGAVYETLLDYQPRVQARRSTTTSRGVPGRQAVEVILERGSSERKATGSFYTPQPMARYLIRQTLGPLVAGRGPDAILKLKVLDPSMGSGAFLVAACSFLAESYEDALVASGVCIPADLGPADRVAILRLVAERCLFGVDLNPMAVQLTRLSLWLATLARDRPLSFLDHHIRVGDSLLGTWLSSLSRPPSVPEDRRPPTTLPLFTEDEVENATRQVMPARLTLSGPNDSIEQVREKERALARLERSDSALAKWKAVADLWCVQALAAHDAKPTAYRSLAAGVLGARSDLPEHVAARQLDECRRLAAARRFFHWELEFPEAFFDGSGQRLVSPGFDAVIGNPPWDMLRNDAGSRGEAHGGAVAHTLRFARRSGLYDLPAGHANLYQLFLTRSISLLRQGGRLGLVLPAGLVTDHTSRRIRRQLFAQCAVESLVGFENRRAIFPIHRSVRFVLLTAARGTPTDRFSVRQGEVDAGILEEHDAGVESWYPLNVSIDLLSRLAGDDLALPDVRRSLDVAIAERAAALYPPLGSRGSWLAEFGRELNATDDRDLLGAERGLPVVGGRHIEPFAVNVGSASAFIRESDASRLLGSRWERPRLAYRDVASPANRLTLIGAMLPARCVSTHTVFCLRTPLPIQAQYFLCGLFNSFILNYLVRLRVTTHVTTAIVERLPVPKRTDGSRAFVEIAGLARYLARRPPAAGAADAAARLQASAARLYQLSGEEFAYLLSTFPLVDSEQRNRALACFNG